jgi:hypothetical protein
MKDIKWKGRNKKRERGMGIDRQAERKKVRVKETKRGNF